MNIWKKRFSGIALLGLLALPVNAQHSGAGTTLFDFIKINYDARTVGLAGASVALPNDCYGIFSNPASLALLDGMQAVVGYRPLGAGIYGVPLAFAMPRKGIGAVGAALYGLTSGKVAVTEKGPDGGVVFTDESASVDNVAGYAVWAKRINEYFSAGVTVKGFYTGIKTFEDGAAVRWSADGFALDCGMQFFFLNSRLIYGAVIRNIGFIRSGFTKDDSGNALPSDIEIGVSYVPRYIENLRVIVDLTKYNDDFLTFTPGAEWEVLPQQLIVRAGYNLNRKTLHAFKNTLIGESNTGYVRTTITGLCLGFGFNTKIVERKVKFDAAAEFLTLPVMPSLAFSTLVDF
jgi:hypothetical protein